MNINFKGGYFNFNFLTKSDWTLSSQSMDNVQSVHGLSGHCPVRLDFVQCVHGQCPDCPLSAWTMFTECMDNVHWVHGQCPLNPWTLSSLACLTGLCPWTHWTLSRVSMDIVQTVHWVHGKCPLSPWTMSSKSTESMDFLQTGTETPFCSKWCLCYAHNSIPHQNVYNVSGPRHYNDPDVILCNNLVISVSLSIV